MKHLKFQPEHKKFNLLSFSMALTLLAWGLLLLSSFVIANGPERVTLFAAKIEFIIHILILLWLIKLTLKLKHEHRNLMIWLLIVNIWLFLMDSSYYIATYMGNSFLQHPTLMEFTLYYAPCIIYSLTAIAFLVHILLQGVLSMRGFIKMVGALIIVNTITLCLLFSSLHHAFDVISWRTFSHIFVLAVELVLFNLCILGLIYTDNNSLLLLLFGTVLLIAGDFFLNYSSMYPAIHLAAYGELVWLLGLLLNWFFVMSIEYNTDYSVKTWFRKSSMIKSRLVFWAFSISLSSFLLFFVIAYILSIINKAVFLGLPLFVLIYSLIVILLSVMMGRNFSAPFKKIEHNIQMLMLNKDKAVLEDNFSTEEFIFLQKFIVATFEKEKRDRVKKELGEITAQVAHDIRSPLSALDMLITCIQDKITEQERAMLRTACRRINHIANDLVEKYKGQQHNQNFPIFIYVVLTDMLGEKELEYNATKLRFELNLDTLESAFLLTLGNCHEMKRMISNLINNAVNAMGNEGKIKVSCAYQGGAIIIKIRDQGCGMPLERVNALLADTVPENSKIGLGLTHAKAYLQQYGGKLEINSILGQGTEVTLKFTALPKPVWLCDELRLSPDATIMIIDDDQSIHDTWAKKVEQFYWVREDYFSLQAADAALKRNKAQKPMVILCDYEFIHERETGLDLLARFSGPHLQRYLVTSQVDQKILIESCQTLGIQMLPKQLLPYVKVNLDAA